MGIVAILYWIWLFAAVAVVAYRIYCRATGQRSRVFEFRQRDPTTPHDAGADVDDAPLGPTPPPPETVPAPIAPPAVAAQITTPPTPAEPATDEASSVDGLDTGEIHPSVLAAMRGDEPDPPRAASPEGTGGLFGAEGRQDLAVGTLAPLRETLTGIAMPCDLVPVTDLGPRPPREQHRERLVLMTTSAGAGEVAARLADELARIGLDVTSTSTTTCVARRQDRAVEVRVHEFPERVTTDGAAAFPTTPDDSVVVELLAA
ncbi:MAG: hypothetical protein OES57_08585 [Acidimicrobiia bacterium]|nr:hypothetical protein [Acidimicrobiia bacterium]